jgi:hypothetical protein
MPPIDVILKRFEHPDEVRTFEKGIFEIVHIGGMTIGRATYQPGWKWSTHVGPTVGASRCNVEHVGLVLSGSATAAMEDGTIHELREGTIFYIPRDLRATTAGCSEISHMSRCTFSVLRITRRSNRCHLLVGIAEPGLNRATKR